jgi:tRNA-splicing ligase RtcB
VVRIHDIHHKLGESMPVREVISEARVPIKIWCEDTEPEAIAQLINTANLPFVYKHVAAMPDVHFGMGATVGSVIATHRAVCPCAVGVDIGCGMMAVQLGIDPRKVQDKVKEIRHSIERSIPVGFEKNKEITMTAESYPGWFTASERIKPMFDRAIPQLGTLGGGNHFIELCTDTDGRLWVMLHSGSRNVGKTTAELHIARAKKIMERYFIELTDPNLSYLAEGTAEFNEYLEDVHWCQEYAFENRKEMMRRILKDLSYAVNGGQTIVPIQEVNCHHNYISREHHYGQNVIVTRKGAVRARVGDLGIIPGSMGARSFIVEGLGNPESFDSCSHGAGRRMSRTRAKNQFTLGDLESQTAGVECRKDVGVLDEIPWAYKNIDKVMDNQSDLVRVVAQLKQFMCIKG